MAGFGFTEGTKDRLIRGMRRFEHQPERQHAPAGPIVDIDHVDRWARVIAGTVEASAGWYAGRLQVLDEATGIWTDSDTGPRVYLQESASGTVVNKGAQDAGVHYSARFSGLVGGGSVAATNSPAAGDTLLLLPSTALYEPEDLVELSDDTGATEIVTVISKVNGVSLTTTALASGYTHPTVTVPSRGLWLLLRSDLDCVVRIVDTVLNGDGMQSGYIQIWDEVNNAWSDGEQVWVLDASSGAGSYCGITSVTTGSDSGLMGGGAGPTLDLALTDTGVAAGTYGDATHVAQFTVDAQGRLTGASAIAITTVPAAAAVGQVLYSVDGATFEARQPLTSADGWLVNADGILLVVG